MRSEQPEARVEGLSDEDRARLHVLDQHGERRLRERIEALIDQQEKALDELAERSTALIEGLAGQFPQVRDLCEQMGFDPRSARAERGGQNDE